MEKNACGIVSYAGLSKETLLSLGKAAFAQSQSPVPKRFDAFLPLFPIELVQNMDYIGLPETRGVRVAPSGFSIDPVEYHRKLYTQTPELYVGDNYTRNFDYEGRYIGRGVFTVDAVWVDHFPQYKPFMGEKLMIHLIGGGFQGVAVPESIYPRGGGALEAVEATMKITQHVELFNQYARARVATGDRYDAEAFQAEFLHTTGLTVLTLTQKEISRALQDLSIVKSLQSDTNSVGLYTENARQAERVNQYVPMRYACDLFTAEAVDKHTARLVQLCNADSDFVSDLWIPYQDFYTYVDRRTMTLDVRRLCEGYQIAPRYDPEGVGGRYPDAVRVAVVHDRELKLLVGEVINNPAYGDGMGPQGMIGRQVYIADSREMIRQRRLTLEEANIVTQNATLPIREYRKSLAQAVLQEHKGRLVDAMYRRETVLTQISPDTAVYAKACALLNDRVDKLKDIVKRESAQSGMSQMSGYDADIDYLHRKQLDREGEPEETQDAKPIAFARDEQREQSIESGYAMRAGLLRMMYQDAALPEPPPEQVIGVDDSEDEAAKETLPLIPAETREVATTAETSTPAKADHAETDGKPEQDIAAPARDTVPETGLPKPTELAEQSTGSDPENDLDAADALPNQAEASDNGQHDAVSHSESEPEDLCHEASEQSQGDPITADASDNDCAQNALTSVSESQTQDTDFETSVTCPQDTGNAEATEPAETDYPEAETGHSEAISESPEVETDHPEAAADHPEAGTEQASVTDGDLRVSDCSANHKRVSLRELKERCEAEPPCAETVAETVKEEPPKPKLAYILRRGSEETASKSFSRMSELLKRHDQ